MLRELALNPAIYAGVGAFLAALWTWIGICFLRDRRRPRLIRADHDYCYGLVYEDFSPNFIPTNADVPEPGTLQFSITTRNYGTGPIKYTLEQVDIRIGSRAMPKYDPRTPITGYMARGAGRIAKPKGFPPGTLNEFYGKGRIEGSADFSICYGPPDGPPVRRLRVSLTIYLVFPKDGAGGPDAVFGYSDNILLEEDGPY